MKRVAIVGSGISACACAVALKAKGIDFTIFEKSPVPGGKLLTEKIDGCTVEGGPDSFLPEKHWTVDLIGKVGLENQLLCTNEEHKGTFIYSHGRLHRLPEGVMLMVPTMIMPLLQSSLISLPGKIRMGMELFVPKRKNVTDESLATFVTRRLGKECLEKIAEPLVAGIHTSNPDNMSVQATFPRFLELEQKYGSLIKGMIRAMKNVKPPPGNGQKKMTYFMSLNEGMQQLVDRCAAVIGSERISVSSEVKDIKRARSGYELTIGSEKEEFDAVVLAVPSYVAKGLLKGMAPTLSDQLSLIEWSSTANVSLAFGKEDIRTDLPGFGFIVPKTEGRKVNAATWTSIKWAHRAPQDHLLIRAFVGGHHHEELVFLEDSEMVTLVRGELEQIAGINAKPVFSKVYRWPNSLPKYTVGHMDRIARIDEARKQYPGLHLIGASYLAVGIGGCVKSGFDAASELELFFRSGAR